MTRRLTLEYSEAIAGGRSSWKNIHTCKLCLYSSTLQACDKCPFKTRRKVYLKIHINRIHLDEQDVEWHKCQNVHVRSSSTSDVDLTVATGIWPSPSAEIDQPAFAAHISSCVIGGRSALVSCFFFE